MNRLLAFLTLASLSGAGCKTNWTFEPQGLRCDNGACPAGLECQDNLCVKPFDFLKPSACTQVTCVTPPANRCEGNSLLTYTSLGTCNEKTLKCEYASTSTLCQDGCQGNVCLGPTETLTKLGPALPFEVTAVDESPNSSGNHILVVGKQGRVAHWNGFAWKDLDSGTQAHLFSVAFVTPNLAYIAGDASTLLEYRGANLQPVTLPLLAGTNLKWVSIAVQNEQHLLIAASDGTHLRYNGVSWSLHAPPNGPTSTQIVSAYISPMGSEYLLGSCQAPALSCVWSAQPFSDTWTLNFTEGNGFTAIGPGDANLSADVLLGKAETPSLLRMLPSGEFQSNNLPGNLTGRGVVGLTSNNNALYALTSSQWADLGAQVFGRLYRLTSSGASVEAAPQVFRLGGGPNGGRQTLSHSHRTAVVVADANAFATTVVRAQPSSLETLALGETWASLSQTPNGTQVAMNRFGDLWISPPGGPNVMRRLEWAPQRMSSVAAGDAFHLLVGDSGTVYRFDTDFRRVATGTGEAWTSVCRASNSEYYLVGAQGRIGKYDGQTVFVSTPQPQVNLLHVSCVGPQKAWACGEDGTLLSLQGETWSAFSTPFPLKKAVVQCFESPDGSVWAAGDNFFYRFAQGEWKALPSLPSLGALTYVANNAIYGVSQSKQLARFDGTQWKILATTAHPIRSSLRVNSKVLFAGEHGEMWEGK